MKIHVKKLNVWGLGGTYLGPDCRLGSQNPNLILRTLENLKPIKKLENMKST